MIATLETHEVKVLNFLTKYSGTHKISEIKRICGAGTDEALKSLEQCNLIEYYLDQDSRFTGWKPTEKAVRAYIPSLQEGTLPYKIDKFLIENGACTTQEIMAEFVPEYAARTIAGRLSEMSHAGQIFKSANIYKSNPTGVQS